LFSFVNPRVVKAVMEDSRHHFSGPSGFTRMAC
jgi:hypothetical protein